MLQENAESSNNAEIRKGMHRLMKQARANAKLPFCFYCKKNTASFCSSHSIPKFSLNNISYGDQLYTLNKALGLTFIEDELGANAAGTFRLICSECDNTIFRLYEDPSSYEKEPSDQTLAQIALKNYLLLISKCLEEIQLTKLVKDDSFDDPLRIGSTEQVQQSDLAEYVDGYKRAKQGGIRDRGNWYYLCSFQKLNYTIPLAAQSAISMVVDFEGNVINNNYNHDPKNKTKEIHVLALPLRGKSVVMTFIDARDKRYKSFYKKIKALSFEDQLATINFIIFAYSENVFISKKLDTSIFESKNFRNICKTGASNERGWSYYLLAKAIQDYDLSLRSTIPNLLSEKYSINYENKI